MKPRYKTLVKQRKRLAKQISKWGETRKDKKYWHNQATIDNAKADRLMKNRGKKIKVKK